MAELHTVNLVNSMLHLVEQVQSAPRDPSNYIPPVRTASLPHNELRVLEAIEKPRHVWNLADQSLSDFTSAQTLRLGPAQDPENVVLRRGDAMRLQGRLECMLQQGRSALDTQVKLLFEAFERPCLFQLCLELRAHSQIIRVITRIVNLGQNVRRPCAIARRICPNPNTIGFRVLSCKTAEHDSGAIDGCARFEHCLPNCPQSPTLGRSANTPPRRHLPRERLSLAARLLMVTACPLSLAMVSQRSRRDFWFSPLRFMPTRRKT
jgi:hypothetical protein